MQSKRLAAVCQRRFAPDPKGVTRKAVERAVYAVRAEQFIAIGEAVDR